MASEVQGALAEARQKISQQAAARGQDVSPWFEANAAPLSILAEILAVFIRQGAAEAGKTAEQLAAESLDQTRSQVAASFPVHVAWFDNYRPLLLLVAQLIAGSLLPKRPLVLEQTRWRDGSVRWSFVGSPHARLAYERLDGTPLTDEDISALKQVGPGLLTKTIRPRSWPTQADAEVAAAALGQRITQVIPLRETNLQAQSEMAKVEPIPREGSDSTLSDEKIAEIEDEAWGLHKNERAILDYLAEHELEAADPEWMAWVSVEQLADELVRLHSSKAQRDWRATETLAREINSLSEHHRPAGLLAAAGLTWQSLSADRLANLYADAAEAGLACAVAFILSLNLHRPDLAPAFTSMLAAQGRLNQAGNALQIGTGIELGIDIANPQLVRKLLAQRWAKQLRFVSSSPPREKSEAQEPEEAEAEPPAPLSPAEAASLDEQMAGKWPAFTPEILQATAQAFRERGPRATAWLESRIAQHRPDLSELLSRFLQPPREDLPPDLRTPAERRAANIAAIKILERGTAILPEEREQLKRYTGWGGLSRKGLSDVLSPEWVPEQRALIHEYYTPTLVALAIAAALRSRIPGLVDDQGRVIALEPSAGIGRMVQALSGDGFDHLRWHAVEYSRISGQLLQALRPDVEVSIGPFEQWVQDHAELFGQIGLIVSNPPYGERGAAVYKDRDPFYQEKSAYTYQLRRGLDFLRPGGIGVFLIPAGFMTGRGAASIERRRKILQRHHLMAAFRLPSETEDGTPLFPGALLVTDVVFFRARGGETATVPPEDDFIVEGRYFEQFPSHILGREVGKEDADDDDHTTKPRWGYQVRGVFERLPEFEERPMCRSCTLVPLPAPKKKPKLVLPDNVQEALQLARRTSQYLAEVSRGDAASLKRAKALHRDLKDALLAWHAQAQAEKLLVAARIKDVPELQPLFTAMTETGLLPTIDNAPEWTPSFVGQPDDIASQAVFLYGQKRSLTLSQLLDFHRSLGGQVLDSEVRARLIAGGLCLDGEDMTLVVPAQDYYSGTLWDKYDRAKASADKGDEQAAAQATKLLEVIKPVTFAEINSEPRLGWLPISVLQAYVTDYLNEKHYDSAKYKLERKGSLVTVQGIEYSDLPNWSRPLLELLGYINHDMVFFKPKTERNQELEEKRQQVAEEYRNWFINWIEGKPEHQAAVTEAFNRLFRGWEPPGYSEADLEIALWNPKYPLYGYQNAGVRRLAANHGGGLFFDVGLGKTRTILAALALAKQEGWAWRAAIAMPGSVIWNWVAEIERVLPEFRYVVIGSKKKIVQRGPRKGQTESDTDTPRERADKWQRFKAGLYDVAFVTYSSLPRTKMRIETLLRFIRESPAIGREIGLQIRNLEDRIRSLSKKSKGGKLNDKQHEELENLRKKYGSMAKSERKQAIYSEREEALAAKYTVLPEGQEFDPDIYWEDLGITWLAYDESHTGKNLWTVGSREGGEPKFLGAPQQGSDIAWQMYFRAAIVRQNAGGSGVHLADATPAKNSPLEFLSLLSFIDDKVWERLGISDPEQYLTQYLKIEKKLIQDTDLTLAERPCVVGFQNLDQLREVLFRYGEFRTAKEVGLKIPEPKTHRIEVDMDAAQEAKYSDYLDEYQKALESTGFNPDARFKALGLLIKMGLVAVHSELDAGPWTFANASSVSTYSSPKLDRIAELIAQRKDCGHLVFLENNATHFWLKERLVAMGVERDRIAVLNGETAGNLMQRQRIAEGFTADEALYDVVIANRIAYEGLNLQTRTCAIYHGDLPWEPATLQQRNGRGQRQGNRYDVINIYYILSKRSMDMGRFQIIVGKREWMAALIESAASETNNPAAQSDMSPEQWLLWLSRDPAKTEQLLELRRAKEKEEANVKTRKIAWATVRSIAVRQRELQSSRDLFQRTRLTEEITGFVDELDRVDAEVWPWKFIVPHIAREPSLSFAPANEGAIWQGARYRKLDHDGDELDAAEFGQIVYAPRLGIGFRSRGTIRWQELEPEVAQKKWSYTRPEHWQEPWPPVEEDLDQEMREFLYQLRHEGVWVYKDARWDIANEMFRDFIWSRFGEEILDAIAASRSSYQAQLPIVSDSKLVLGDAARWRALGRVLPMTLTGYQEFLALARDSDLKWSDVEAISEWWWGRHIPRDLLAHKHEAQQAA